MRVSIRPHPGSPSVLFTLLASIVAMLGVGLLVACGGGNDNSNPLQTGVPPGTNTPPGGSTPQVTGQPGRFNSGVDAIISAPDATGDIYAAGSFTTYNGQPVPPLVRIRPDGSLNNSFTVGINLNVANGRGVLAMAPVDDGSGDIYVAETQSADSNRVLRISKLNPDGSVDSTFAPAEAVYTTADVILIPTVRSIVPLGDGSGRAYVCGAFDRYNGAVVSHIALVTPSGTLDPAFHSAAPGPTSTVVPADDGSGDLYVMNWRIIDIIGPTTTSTDVYRLNADGSVDPAFKTLTTIASATSIGTLGAVLPAGDGSGDVFIGGSGIFLGIGSPVPVLNPSGFTNLARVNPDGTFDLTSPKPALTESISIMARALDGTRDILITSRLATMASSVESHLGRFKADTSVDPAFTTGTISTLVRTFLPLADGTGDLYVGGDIATYNGVAVGNIVRLNGNGTLDGS